MMPSQRPGERSPGLGWWLLSVPIAVRILGLVGALLVMLTAVTLGSIRGSVARALDHLLEERARYMAHATAAQVEHQAAVGDTLAVEEAIKSVSKRSADVRYIIVQDARRRIVAETPAAGVPLRLLASAPESVSPEGTIQRLPTRDGLVLDAAVPLLGGRAGMVRLGLDDRTAQRQLSAITRNALEALALCAALGLGLGVVLTFSIAHPIRHLVRATEGVRQGDFEVRAPIHVTDEIGQLAACFNRMAEALQSYRVAVQEKEAERLALIDRIVSIEEAERLRIARELHDEMGQALSSLLLTLRASARDDDCPNCLVHREHMATLIRDLIDQVRRLAWDMRPSLLDDYGLDSALQQYTHELSERAGIAIDYESSGLTPTHRLSGEIETCLYRIAQEALTNIIRHAQADQASVVLLRRPGEAILLIEDDGVGFDPTLAGDPGHRRLGLVGMRERAALVGGDFVIQSAPGEGATIRVRVPVAG
jgi:signal transduction histidine kinase